MSYVQIQKGGKGNSANAKYVYLAWNEWNSQTKRSVQRRFYVGRLTEDGADVQVNKKFAGGVDASVPLDEVRKQAVDRGGFEAWLRGRVDKKHAPDGVARVEIAGDAWLVRYLAEASGLTQTLEQVFGKDDGGVLAGLAAHQFVTGHALYRAENWLSQREFPDTWKSPTASESAVYGFVSRIGGDVARRESFIEQWCILHKDRQAVVFDTTSVSSYSPNLEIAEWGYNRDEELLPQVNFSLAATPEGMPLFYRVLPGSIPDVRTVDATLQIARDYGLDKLSLSLDRGFYSTSNLRDLLALDCGLVIGAPWSSTQAKQLFKKHRGRLASPKHAFLYNGKPIRHAMSDWTLDDSKLAAHLFFDPERNMDGAMRCEKAVFALLDKAAREDFKTTRDAWIWINENSRCWKNCLGVNQKDGKITVVMKPTSVVAATARTGYALVLTRGRDASDETAEAVLRDFRSRDMAEKLFDAFKNEHAQYRLRTADEASVNGRFFLGFIALVLRAELEKRMRESGLHKSMTCAGVLDELGKSKSLITCRGNRVLLEVSKKQRTVLTALNAPELV